MMRRAASKTSTMVRTPTTMSASVMSPARSTRSASNTQWYSPATNAATPISQPSPLLRKGGCNAKVTSSRKPTCTARTTLLDSGLKAAVTIWKVEKTIATQNNAPTKDGGCSSGAWSVWCAAGGAPAATAFIASSARLHGST